MLVYWVWLAGLQELSEQTKYKLLQHFGDPEAVYRAGDYSGIAGLGSKSLAALQKKDTSAAERICEECKRKQIGIVTCQDQRYPKRLLGIQDPPILLYYRGRLPDTQTRPVIGAVGTRRCSEEGIRTARQLGYQLCDGGALICSGMAQGIDTGILCGALSAGGEVMVILAGGVDVIYPVENDRLYHNILRRGCILSENSPGTKPLRWSFPKRNRLISGISNGVLVVEAPEKSGAMITARHAMEQGRDVFAVPCGIRSSTGKGCNDLISDGATLVQNGWSVLREFEAIFPETVHRQQACPTDRELEQAAHQLRSFLLEEVRKIPAEGLSDKKVIDKSPMPPYIDVEKKPIKRTPQQQAILQQLSGGPKMSDAVIAESGLSETEAMMAVTVLEISGAIQRLPGNMLALNEM